MHSYVDSIETLHEGIETHTQPNQHKHGLDRVL